MRDLSLLALALLWGCAEKPVQKIENAQVRLSATPKGPAAAYFTLRGGSTEDRLIAITADYAIRAEVHESVTTNGIASMKPITQDIVVPAGGTVKFERGGKHAMLFGVDPALQPPMAMPMTFTFASGERFLVRAPVKRAGDE